MSQTPKSSGRILPLQRGLFDIPDGVTYLNCASMSPQLRSVSDAGFNAVRRKVTPWKITPADWFAGAETLREIVAQLIGASMESIALIPSASYGIAIAAANAKVDRGQSVIVLQEDYPSNFYAWKELMRRTDDAHIRIVRKVSDETWTQSIINAIDDTTAVVAVPNCRWTDGALVDLEAVSASARRVGAALVVDASQSLGVYPIDLAKVQPDFLVSVGYKWLLGPYALGYLYAAPKWQETGKPIENSWLNRAGSEDFSRALSYTDEYRSGARRFDMGEFPNFVLVPMAIAGLRQIFEWRVDSIRQTLSILTDMIANQSAKLGYVCLPRRDRVDHMIGVKFPNGIPPGLDEQLAKAGIYVSIFGDSIRIAPYVYNDQEDIERLFAVLRKFV